MIVHLYTISWNEVRVLGFFLRHYDSVVDRFIVFDDGSTDGTVEILRNHPKVELRRFERRSGDSLVLSMLAVYNESWKESRGSADWVIIANVDEHLHHPRFAEYLADCRRKGVTVIPALGYQMISETFPEPSARLSETVTRGAPYGGMNKLQIFDPNAVREVNYIPGRHKAHPRGKIRWPERDEVVNLHYKFLDRDYVRQRHAELGRGLRKTDLTRGWGHQYLWSESELDSVWEEFAHHTVDIGDPGLEPWNSHAAPRWWRERPIDRLRNRLWRQWRRWMARRPAAALN